MATLTYDPSEAQEGELSAEEQDSLKVGEALAEQEGKKLAGKFEDAEALEKAYIELQSKLGEPKEEKAEVKEEKTEAKEETKGRQAPGQICGVSRARGRVGSHDGKNCRDRLWALGLPPLHAHGSHHLLCSNFLSVLQLL